MAVYITGDIHGSHSITKLSTKNFPEQRSLTKDDCVIVCGDFGLIWYTEGHRYHNEEKFWLDWLNNKPFTTLFVDGNHENFDLLNKVPTTRMFGGIVGKVSDSVFHLRRGEIYKIQDKRFFCFGGASSHDKHLRTEGTSWWKEENPIEEEYQNGFKNLDEHDWTVDFVVSHCAATSVLGEIAYWYESDKQSQYFENIKEFVNYSHWYFGHYHIDREIDEQHTCLYDDIIQII